MLLTLTLGMAAVSLTVVPGRIVLDAGAGHRSGERAAKQHVGREAVGALEVRKVVGVFRGGALGLGEQRELLLQCVGEAFGGGVHAVEAAGEILRLLDAHAAGEGEARGRTHRAREIGVRDILRELLGIGEPARDVGRSDVLNRERVGLHVVGNLERIEERRGADTVEEFVAVLGVVEEGGVKGVGTIVGGAGDAVLPEVIQDDLARLLLAVELVEARAGADVEREARAGEVALDVEEEVPRAVRFGNAARSEARGPWSCCSY